MIDTSVEGIIFVKDGHGHVLAKVYDKDFDSHVCISRSQAVQIARNIEQQLGINPNVRVIEDTSCITVKFGSRSVDFYWCENSRGYGIRTRREAIELANYLRDNIDAIVDGCGETPTPRNRIENDGSRKKIYKDGILYASVITKYIGKLIDDTEYYQESRDLESHGLKAHCPKWDRIIRSDMMDKDLLKRICFFCMRYMDDNWR